MTYIPSSIDIRHILYSVIDCETTCSLRSSDTALLMECRSSTNFGSYAFSCAAPVISKNLKPECRHTVALEHFKLLLKTQMFETAYANQDCAAVQRF